MWQAHVMLIVVQVCSKVNVSRVILYWSCDGCTLPFWLVGWPERWPDQEREWIPSNKEWEKSRLFSTVLSKSESRLCSIKEWVATVFYQRVSRNCVLSKSESRLCSIKEWVATVFYQRVSHDCSIKEWVTTVFYQRVSHDCSIKEWVATVFYQRVSRDCVLSKSLSRDCVLSKSELLFLPLCTEEHHCWWMCRLTHTQSQTEHRYHQHRPPRLTSVGGGRRGQFMRWTKVVVVLYWDRLLLQPF